MLIFQKIKLTKSYTNSSIPIGISSYARISIIPYKTMTPYNSPVYSDTDSIVLEKTS